MSNNVFEDDPMCYQCNVCEGILQHHWIECLQQIHNISGHLLQKQDEDGEIHEDLNKIWCMLVKCMEVANDNQLHVNLGAIEWLVDEFGCCGPNVGGWASFTVDRVQKEMKLLELVKTWPIEHWEG